MSQPPRLELRSLVKRFDAVQAVRGLSLAVGKGEFVSLLGPSGCGKSTTLAMIAGFEQPTEGEIRVDGRVVNDLPPQRRRIGLVFQDYAVFSRLTVAANLGFGLAGRGLGWGERRRRVAAMAEKLGLADRLKRRGDSLNMSEMQRVALGRVLLTEPELLLLDEPMSNLDAALRAALRGELKQLQRELGQTVLYVTHDQVEAMSMSDRIAIMRDGALLQIGTPDEIYDRPVDRFVAEFIGDPPINLIGCEVTREGGELVAATALHRGLRLGRGDLAPGRHQLAIRPHDLALGREPQPDGIAVEVGVVEDLGAECVLHLDYAGETIRAVAPPGFARPGERLQLRLPPERLHLIEAGSGRVVRPAALERAA
ncbi:MAG: ABC transporter ATP-binding protein [Dongiaceae bacterium]